MNTTTRGLLACTVLCALIVALSGVARAGGVTRYEQKTNTISVNGGRQGTVSATCSAGNVVLSGGFSVTSPTLEIASSLPSAATAGWTVTVNNAGRLAQSVTVTATCVASSSVSGYEQPSSTISVNPSSSANVNVACSAGNVIVGGGYSVADPTVVGVSHSEPSHSSNLSNTNWDVAASNSSSTVAENVTAQGICVSSAISNYEEVPAQQSVGPSGSATLTASCSPGNEVLGGSFQVETTTFVSVTAAQPSSSSAWSEAAANSDSVARLISTVAICAAPLPAVTAVSPSSGPAAGGTKVTITGTGFTGATAVKFGATAASSFTVNSATRITATAPAGTAGTVDITTTTPGGTSPTGVADHYTYVPAPTISAISPTSGPLSGGTSVTITGTGFTGATAVKFGAIAASSFTVNSATRITATAPAGTAGTVDITTTTPGGTSPTGVADHYTYVPAPTISAISPTSGPLSGGTSVTITGTGFTGATAVKFGATAASSFTVNSATRITATAPAGTAGTVDITTTTPGGTSPTGVADHYTYVPAPTISAISPTSGPLSGGTSVTITGTGFTGATAVKFGATAASSFTVNSATRITATAPAGTAGTVDITTTTPGGTSPTGVADHYTYVPAPTISAISPTSGPLSGGTSVTITGSDLAGVTAVEFGSTAASSFTVNSATQITATAPAGMGTVDITVTSPGGISPATTSDRYTYTATSPPRTTVPALVEDAPVVIASTKAAFSGSVDPNGLPTTAHFEYKLDPSLGGPAGATSYDQQTAGQTVGSDSTAHPISANVAGLVPNATYHVRLVADNGAGTSFGSDQTFKTARDPAPPPPKLARSFDAQPLSGVVFIKPPSGGSRRMHAAAEKLTKGQGFFPLTEARLIPAGSQIDARAGTLQLVTATGTGHSKTQNGTFGGALFKASQARSGISKGLTTLRLLADSFPGAPSYSQCRGGRALDARSARGSRILQTLHARDNHGKFRTTGRYSAGTVRGTGWDTTEECAGTLTVVHRGTVDVLDFGKRTTITVHAGHRYLALPKHK